MAQLFHDFDPMHGHGGMRGATRSPMVTVALFGADEDSVLVRLGLREAGLAATGAYVQEVQSGDVDLAEFLGRARPDVVIYDFVQPAARSLRWLRKLEQVCEAQQIPCVLTVRDVRDLHHVVAGWAACILIRPYDAEMARLAIREAISADDDDHVDDEVDARDEVEGDDDEAAA
jgi:DNA-binding NarL/FixJ family response regulator